MAKLMYTFDSPKPLSIAEAKQRFGLADDEIDAAFGVVEIDPKTHTYAIRVDEQAARRLGQSGSPPDGPFSDPKIAPFGPPRR